MNSYKHHQLGSFLQVKYRSLFTRLNEWIRRELVDDDPWDVDTLFAQELEHDRVFQDHVAQNLAHDIEFMSQDAIVFYCKNRTFVGRQNAISNELLN